MECSLVYSEGSGYVANPIGKILATLVMSADGPVIHYDAVSAAWWEIFTIPDEKVNSLATGRYEDNIRWVIFKLAVVIDGWGISCEIALRWMSLDLTDDNSTLVQVMAWCHQA